MVRVFVGSFIEESVRPPERIVTNHEHYILDSVHSFHSLVDARSNLRKRATNDCY